MAHRGALRLAVLVVKISVVVRPAALITLGLVLLAASCGGPAEDRGDQYELPRFLPPQEDPGPTPRWIWSEQRDDVAIAWTLALTPDGALRVAVNDAAETWQGEISVLELARDGTARGRELVARDTPSHVTPDGLAVAHDATWIALSYGGGRASALDRDYPEARVQRRARHAAPWTRTLGRVSASVFASGSGAVVLRSAGIWPLDPSDSTARRFSDAGDLEWERPLPLGYHHASVLPDGSLVVFTSPDGPGVSEALRLAPDGRETWSQSLDGYDTVWDATSRPDGTSVVMLATPRDDDHALDVVELAAAGGPAWRIARITGAVLGHFAMFPDGSFAVAFRRDSFRGGWWLAEIAGASQGPAVPLGAPADALQIARLVADGESVYVAGYVAGRPVALGADALDPAYPYAAVVVAYDRASLRP